MFSGHEVVVVWLQAAVYEGKEVWHIWSTGRRDLWPGDAGQVKGTPQRLHGFDIPSFREIKYIMVFEIQPKN